MILSAFADEIDADVGVQLAVLHRHGIGHVDLRGAGAGNVIDLDEHAAAALRERFRAHGISVAAIASPIGKEPADADPADLRRRMARAGAIARLVGADLVRVFGFRPPAKGGEWEQASLASLRVLASCARAEDVTLVLENEVGTRADTAERTAALLESLADERVRAAFDPANALRCRDTPYPDGYARLRPWLRQVHVKDLDERGRVVPAGHGQADWPGLLDALRRDRYDGFISLEPHLLRAGRAGGFTGPTLFGEAHRALRALVASNGTRPAPVPDHGAVPLTLMTIRGEGADEGLLVHPDGTTLEASTASVFWAKQGVLRTPAVVDGIPSSITRIVLMEALDTEEVSASIDELLGADEVFLASTSSEIQPVERIDDVEYEEAPGPLCRAARRALDDAVAREATSTPGEG